MCSKIHRAKQEPKTDRQRQQNKTEITAVVRQGMEELEALNMLPCDAVCLRSAVTVNLLRLMYVTEHTLKIIMECLNDLV